MYQVGHCLRFIYKYAIKNNTRKSCLLKVSSNSVCSYLLVCFIHRCYTEKCLCYVFL